MEKMKKMMVESFQGPLVELDPICSIESPILLRKLKNACDGPPIRIPIESSILIIVFYYCKKRAKIKLQRHQHSNDENLTAQLKEFDNKFLDYIRQYPDSSIRIDIVQAALHLRVKSLYELLIVDVAEICNALTTKELRRAFTLGRYHRHEEESSFIWAFAINDARHVELDTTK